MVDKNKRRCGEPVVYGKRYYLSVGTEYEIELIWQNPDMTGYGCGTQYNPDLICEDCARRLGYKW